MDGNYELVKRAQEDGAPDEYRRLVGELIDLMDTLGKEKAARRIAEWILSSRNEVRALRGGK